MLRRIIKEINQRQRKYDEEIEYGERKIKAAKFGIYYLRKLDKLNESSTSLMMEINRQKE